MKRKRLVLAGDHNLQTVVNKITGTRHWQLRLIKDLLIDKGGITVDGVEPPPDMVLRPRPEPYALVIWGFRHRDVLIVDPAECIPWQRSQEMQQIMRDLRRVWTRKRNFNKSLCEVLVEIGDPRNDADLKMKLDAALEDK